MTLTEENYVNTAEQVIRKINENPKNLLSTSQIRNILSMISNIYNTVVRSQDDKLDSAMKGTVQYLKMHIAYAAGRNPKVKTFVNEAELFKAIDAIGDSKEKLIVFCHYMEALVAYRKYLGEREND